jgi:hypothetical protein
MECMDKMLDALEDCGEAAAFYKGQNILKSNGNFAQLFERSPEECEGLLIREICHDESIEMIQDYIHRRARQDPDAPPVYEAMFRTPSRERVNMYLHVLRLKNLQDAFLVIMRESD